MENTNTQAVQFKRGFLFSLIVFLSISALVAIYIFIFGNFEETQVKILLTTLAICGFSLVSFCHSILYEKKGYRIFTRIGIIVSFIALLFTIISIWDLLYDLDLIPYADIETFSKLNVSFAILSIASTHISLLLISDKTSKIISVILRLTLLFIVAFSFALIFFLFNSEILSGDLFLRLLGVLAVLDVLGTILLPILRKVLGNKVNQN